MQFHDERSQSFEYKWFLLAFCVALALVADASISMSVEVSEALLLLSKFVAAEPAA